MLAAIDALPIYLRDVATGRLTATIAPPRHIVLRSLGFSPGGRNIAATGDTDSAYVWDIGQAAEPVAAHCQGVLEAAVAQLGELGLIVQIVGDV